MTSYTTKSTAIETSYNNQMSAYHQKSTAVSQANQQAQNSYNIAMSSYNSALSAWKTAHNENVNVNGLDTTTVTQAFNLASDTNATLNVESLNPNVKVVHLDGDGWDKNQNASLIYTAGDWAKVPINGPIARATWTNLHGSFYDNTPISRMVITFSDSLPTGNLVHPSGVSKDAFLNIWKNPTQQLFHSTEITAKYEFYDQNGKLIDFNNDNAWMSVGSLNTDQNQNSQHVSEVGQVSEAVKLISGGQSYAIRGSSISKHPDGWLYTNYDNFMGTGLNNGKNWDQTDSPNAYYGACVFKLEGPSLTLRYGLKESVPGWIKRNAQNIYLNQAWATAVTTIPVTPGPKHPVPPTIIPNSIEPPTKQSVNPPTRETVVPKTAMVSYHSNTLILFFLIFSANCIRVIRYYGNITIYWFFSGLDRFSWLWWLRWRRNIRWRCWWSRWCR